MSGDAVSVVICTYTEERAALLERAMAAATSQLREGDELVVVVDHCAPLFERLLERHPMVSVIESTGSPGLSGARNTGVKWARGELLAFLDDDAVPESGWLEALRGAFADERVAGAGGWVEAEWEVEMPRWWPAAFHWVVGCSYQGLPGPGEPIRNPIGASMAIRRRLVVEAGGFASAVGRTASLPAGCEETELCIRIRRHHGNLRFVHQTSAVVRHSVPARRARRRYFLERCYREGRSKAVVAELTGPELALASERDYVRNVLAREIVRDALSVTRLSRSVMALAGLALAAGGYAVGVAKRLRPGRGGAGGAADEVPAVGQRV